MGNDTTIVSLPGGPVAEAQDGESCLVVVYGGELGRRVPLAAPLLTVGRSPASDLSLIHSDVSRSHCRFKVGEAGVTVCDLESTNGTFVNDREIPSSEETPLQSGDHVHVGGVIFKFLEGGNVEALYHEEVYRTMVVDGLTQVNNRRFLLDFMEREMARCRRHDRDLSLIMLDVDRFKRVNDEFGHLAGDHVLRGLAGLIRSQTRREECVARFGGEEFTVVLPETNLAGAMTFAERLRAGVEMHDFIIEGRRVSVTVSLGATALEPEMEGAEAFLRAADALLYEAKNAGRNRVAAAAS
jgi:diguanylate cyclase (GGDEF)-like protein